MPLIDSQLRTPGGPPSWRPHVWLLAGLVTFMLALTSVSGWVS